MARWLFFAATVYWIDGDPAPSPGTELPDHRVTNVYYASAIRGVVGTWTLNPNLTIHDRVKSLLYTAYGQIISAEGVYTGSPGSGEMETSTFNADGTLNPWNGLTGSSAQVPQANVYNAGGFVSPLFTSTKRTALLDPRRTNVYLDTAGRTQQHGLLQHRAPVGSTLCAEENHTRDWTVYQVQTVQLLLAFGAEANRYLNRNSE